MKNNAKNLTIFVCICSVITLLLALTNALTTPRIKENQEKATKKALLSVMPEGESFEPVVLTDYDLPQTVTEVYKETTGKGYVIKLKTTGYRKDMVIMCGIDPNGVVTGAVCLSSNETLGKEKTYGDSFKNKDYSSVDEVDTISSATKTTKAYKNAVKDAINAAKILAETEINVHSNSVLEALNSENNEKGEFGI